MKKRVILIGIVLCCFKAAFSQNASQLWEGHFSYLNIKDVVSGTDKVFAASENAIFSYDINTKELETITTVEGLSGDLISTIHYSVNFETLIIGYESGLIEIYDEASEEITTVVDIIEKLAITPDKKRINHFSEQGDLIFVATEYGISEYNLNRLEFGDTYYIGTGGSLIPVKQTTIFQDYIYAACSNGEGIKRAEINNPNLIDFQEWEQVVGGTFNGIEALQDKIYCTSVNRRIYELVGSTLVQLAIYPTQVLDLKTSNDQLTVTIRNAVYVYDRNFNSIANPVVTPEFDTRFTSAITTSEGIYIGTEDFGLLKTTESDISSFEEIHPDGPQMNNTFAVTAGFGQVWTSYGTYSEFYNPHDPTLDQYGVSLLRENTWKNFPYSELLNATDLNTININPLNPNQVFINSYHRGLLEIVDEVPVKRHDNTNSGLEQLIFLLDLNYISIRLSGGQFDNSGILWTITSQVDRPLKSYDPSTDIWRAFDFTSIISNSSSNQGFKELVIDDSGTIFITTAGYGLIGFRENGGGYELKNLERDAGNLPVNSIRALALDTRNQLWIGTNEGLRVLYNTAGFFTDEGVQTEPIIILENGLPRELMENQYISDIKVDGANNKWVATIGAGLFYFSYDGQQTIYHFTKSNSPLPSNNINEVSIDKDNGVVYIATDKGLVSFRSGGSSTTEELTDAHVFPNPVRPGFNMTTEKVKIKDITDNVNIKIVDIEGNLVAEAQSRTNLRHRGFNLEIDGGTAYWNGKNMANNEVASGVYLVMLSDLDTLETKVLKLMVVR